MAARKSTKTKTELAPQSDPRAPLPFDAFLGAAQKSLVSLAEDLLQRADASPGVTAALMARHEADKAAHRTADGFDVYRRRVVGQVAAAWLLSLVFVRTLEDRGLVDRNRIAGPGALDSQRQFSEIAPHLNERDYLLTIFRELSNLEAAKDLFDPKHDLLWKLAPSFEGAQKLLGLFRTPNAEAPTFRFGQSDTRFLGDLYQLLDEDVRERFALLQTPRFVEKFILDRTLERSVAEFGLDATTLIDPTCGSGHFLLGAFDRLFDHQLRTNPSLDKREAVVRALDAVHGVDINPYAIGIARFRLTLEALEKGGWTKIEAAPRLPLHLVAADSLLHRVAAGQTSFGDVADQSARVWKGEQFALEDEEAAKAVLAKRYAVVVGNPPYITVKDAALRDEYRKLYPRSCYREYSLGAPFSERFFDLARERGFVGMITANSFMKREFGKRLIEDYFKSVNIELIANTSGAFIPGHGTPTVLIFGRNERPTTDRLVGVLAKRGEPTTPEDPEHGLVWRSLADHFSDVGYENDYVSVAQIDRSTIQRHPWSLGGGGAAELKELLEERAAARLSAHVKSIGFMCITKQDDVFSQELGVLTRRGVPPDWIGRFVIGEQVRDWTIACDLECVFPYAKTGELRPIEGDSTVERFLWPFRAVLESRAVFGGKTFREAGRPWYAYGQIPTDRIEGAAITFAFVATHNHFVLDRGGKVFNRSAPIIKLPATATEEDHLALLGYLNSSTACFWMKQVCHDKGSGSDAGNRQEERAKFRFEFSATALLSLPVPHLSPRFAELAAEMDTLAHQRAHALSTQGLAEGLDAQDVEAILSAADEHDAKVTARLICLQEQLDWLAYSSFGLGPAPRDPWPESISLGQRPFETLLHSKDETLGIDGQELGHAPPGFEELWRELACESSTALIESSEYKRRWALTPRESAGAVWTARDQCLAAMRELIAQRVETALSTCAGIASQAPIQGVLAGSASSTRLVAFYGAASIATTLADNAVPFASALRFTDSGLEKHAAWLHTWDLQRREDAGETIDAIPVPPKYDSKDYRDPIYWRLRGKLDVPKERFISYPGCESDEDNSPVYGWAGWNHLQQAQALAALYQKRKTEEGWGKDRLVPMLAGLDELVPWVIQWHNEPSEEFNGLRLGHYYRDFVAGECQALGVTLDEVRAWRPESKKGRAKKAAKRSTDDTDGEAEP